MDLTAQDYAEHLGWLLPEGPAWSDEIVKRLVTALAIEPSRLDARIADAIREADPRSAVQLLGDWERVLGLPDKCTVDIDLTTVNRQQIAWAKLTEEGGQSKPYFIALAARYGEHDVRINDGFRPPTCEDDCEAAFYSEDDRYVWEVVFDHPADDFRVATCEDNCESALDMYQPSLAECPLRERKPAHTELIFTYAPIWLLELGDWRYWMKCLDIAVATLPRSDGQPNPTYPDPIPTY